MRPPDHVDKIHPLVVSVGVVGPAIIIIICIVYNTPDLVLRYSR